ncbi:MAG: hypothetical protein WC856_19825 [Methylococcaceae bacterium]
MLPKRKPSHENKIRKERNIAEQLTHLDDRFWNRLLKAIEEGQVVPVIGSQLLTWNDQDKIQSLQQHVAMRVLELYKVDATPVTLKPHRELHEVVTLLKPTANLQDPYGDISDALDAVMKEPNFKLSDSIEKLAAISSFKLLVAVYRQYSLKKTRDSPRVSANMTPFVCGE